MSTDANLTADDLLELETKQAYMFLTSVRPVGMEEKSDLYPEPQYMNAALMALAVNLPYTLRKILERTPTAGSYGARARRILSPVTAVHFSANPFGGLTWGREMLLMEKGVPGQRPGVVFDDGILRYTDADAAAALHFSYQAATHYRADGRAYPSETQALGSDYRILAAEEAETLAQQTRSVDRDSARDLLGLMASIRSLSFVMEAETREALMVHGPYAVGTEGHLMVVFECNDLRWPLFPHFPISGGARWILPLQPFPTANIAIVLVLKDIRQIQADRFGTLYIEPLTADNVLSASLLTRGTDPYCDEGLNEVPLRDARLLRQTADQIQEFMFLQVAEWSFRQRMEAGVLQEQTYLLRQLAAVDYGLGELEREQQILFERSERVWGRHFDAILATPPDQIAFYRKLSDFVAGKTPRLFTPLKLI